MDTQELQLQIRRWTSLGYKATIWDDGLHIRKYGEDGKTLLAKNCNTCQAILPIEKFYVGANPKSRMPNCRRCQNEYAAYRLKCKRKGIKPPKSHKKTSVPLIDNNLTVVEQTSKTMKLSTGIISFEGSLVGHSECRVILERVREYAYGKHYSVYVTINNGCLLLTQDLPVIDLEEFLTKRRIHLNDVGQEMKSEDIPPTTHISTGIDILSSMISIDEIKDRLNSPSYDITINADRLPTLDEVLGELGIGIELWESSCNER